MYSAHTEQTRYTKELNINEILQMVFFLIAGHILQIASYVTSDLAMNHTVSHQKIQYVKWLA